MHHALQVLETRHHEGEADAIEVAIETFAHYWDPENIDALVPGGVEIWTPTHTYQGLLTRGRQNLRDYYADLQKDVGVLMGLEVQFEGPLWVPDEGTRFTVDGAGRINGAIDGGRGQRGWTEHEMTGTLDRLALRKTTKGMPYLSVDDFKSGVKKTFLRFAFQWTYYSWASLQPWFWELWTEEELAPILEMLAKKDLALYDDGSGRKVIPRKGRWISIRNQYKIHDAGWRNARDYGRMFAAVREYVGANEKDSFPLRIDGETCMHCVHGQTGLCGGVPLANVEEEGVPA